LAAHQAAKGRQEIIKAIHTHMNNLREQVDPKVELIWKIADLLRGDYKCLSR
jgi:hypothetical protein